MMGEHRQALAAFVDRVRARWRAAVALNAWTRAAAVAAAVLTTALIVTRAFVPALVALVVLWSVALAVCVAALAWLHRPVRRAPTDAQVARYVEEHCPELDDALVTAIADSSDSPLREAVVEDAAKRIAALDADCVVSTAHLRRRAGLALAATLALAFVVVQSSVPLSRAGQAAMAYAFPGRLTLDVIPGSTKVRGGSALEVRARVGGTEAAVVPVLVIREQETEREVPMQAAGKGFAATLEDVQRSFSYQVKAAGAASSAYSVTVMHPPHVERIDVRYEYPRGFGMSPRVEEDGGDVYGPIGTRVQLTVHTDKPIRDAAVMPAGGHPVALTSDGRRPLLTGTMTIGGDGSYRIRLVDSDGLENPGDTEYFIRTIQDSPPDVRMIRPGADRPVTPIEEVTVEARADDDFGIAALDLVFSVRGRAEQVVPFRRGGSGPSVTGEQILFLEDLRVQPGDFVTYYARARDVSRGKRSSEARSDIFFLEVKPFDEEFVAADGNGAGGGAGGEDSSLEALIAGQKDVITATWRLDRRRRDSGRQSADDVRAVGRAQGELRRRATGMAGAPLAKAVEAMTSAHEQLDALRTSEALPHEMTALNELLRAQAEIRRRRVQRQEANNNTGGGGSNRQTEDLSSLFDRELAKQQTNYETPNSTETREQKPQNGDDALEQIRELARRQEALNREQERLAGAEGRDEQERRRQLDRLTREQSELRQQAEALAQQLQRGQSAGERGAAGRALQEAARDMQRAASGLRRQDEEQATAGGRGALDRLRAGERRLGGSQPDDRRRVQGELEMEARQLADAQRRLARDARQQPSSGTAAADAARRRAGEQERLADRMQRLEQSATQLGGGAGDAARELERQRLSERMRKAARAADSRAAAEAEDIARALDRIGDRLGGAADDPVARQSAEQLARARALREQLDAVDRQLSQLNRDGRGGNTGRQSGRGDRQAGRGGQRSGGPSGPRSGTGGRDATDGAWDQARKLLDDARRQQEMGLNRRDIEGFNPGLSAPGTEAWKQDFAKWEELKVQLAAALEQLETSAAARLRQRQDRDRLHAGRSQAVPEAYRDLVDRYYRALASPARRREEAK